MCLGAALTAAGVPDRVVAQSWSPGFNHNTPHAANGVFTSPHAPWSGLAGSSAPLASDTFTAPSFVPANVTYLVQGAMVDVFHDGYGWPQPDPSHNGRCFEAVHMAVIPKGPFRGHVLVWDINSVVAKVHPLGLPPTVPQIPAQPSGQSYQAYAIIDPADAPVSGIRYRNYLVPIGTPLSGVTYPLRAKNLFCSGHAWSPYGDLIVAGGTDFVFDAQGAIVFAGGTLNYVFNPKLPCFWPGTSFAYHPTAGSVTHAGMWQRGPDLQVPRWYPTVTMSHGLLRETQVLPAGTAPDKERAVIFGGSEDVPPLAQDRANSTYEALVVLGEAAQGPGNSNLVVDQYPGQLLSFLPTMAQQGKVWDGPVFTGTVNTDWLYEYPRVFLLSTGQMFVCGYAPRSAWIDMEAPPGIWTLAVGQPGLPPLSYSSNWQSIRHDGSAVLFPNLGGRADTVLRVGGGRRLLRAHDGHGGIDRRGCRGQYLGVRGSDATTAARSPGRRAGFHQSRHPADRRLAAARRAMAGRQRPGRREAAGSAAVFWRRVDATGSQSRWIEPYLPLDGRAAAGWPRIHRRRR